MTAFTDTELIAALRWDPCRQRLDGSSSAARVSTWPATASPTPKHDGFAKGLASGLVLASQIAREWQS